jgi:toxin ParE1/3/4
MRVRYTPRARGDIEQIYRFLEERSPAGARNVLRAIYAGVQFISEFPQASERTDDPQVRVRIVRAIDIECFTASSMTILPRFFTFDIRRGGHGSKNESEAARW